MKREAIWAAFRPHLYWCYGPEGYVGHYWASKGVADWWREEGFTLIQVSHAEGRF